MLELRAIAELLMATPPAAKIGCAILAATGVVGQRFAQLLAPHPFFEVRCLIGNASAGTRYRGAVHWLPDAPLDPRIGNLPIETIESLPQRDVRVVFSALPAGVAGPIERKLASLGYYVFTNARDLRDEPDVPLLIPEVNPDHLHLVAKQVGPGWVVANGNCTGIILQLPLAAIHRSVGVESVNVVTMNGLSGAGYPGVSSLDVVDNIVPYIGGEEERVETEPLKCLGTLQDGVLHHAIISITATCTRVPVRDGHLEAVTLRLSRPTTPDEIEGILAGFRGPQELASCPSAPTPPIIVAPEPDRPQPRRDRDAANGMAVTVGRIRCSPDGHQVSFIVLGHNAVRGAAGQSILNAEYARAAGFLEGALVAGIVTVSN